MALVGTAAPMVTDLKQADELLMLCSSIGMTDHDETSADVYHKGDEAREVLQDLTRVLRREDKHSKHSYLRQLGVIQVFQKDLVPLLVQYGGFGNDVPADRATKENNKMVFALLKLMVAMTMPAMITFDGALEKIEETREFAQVSLNSIVGIYIQGSVELCWIHFVPHRDVYNVSTQIIAVDVEACLHVHNVLSNILPSLRVCIGC